MANAHAIENLRSAATLQPPLTARLLALLLRYEAWLDRRAGARRLRTLNDRALSDIGLSRADVERLNAEADL